jgi:uncharacterized protein YndB with AHSA1/START domain
MNTEHFESVYVNQAFNASPEIVFDAWIKPEMIREWLFVGPSSEIIKVDINPEVGGKFSILEHETSNGDYIDHFGKYIQIKRPNLLAFTLSVPKHFPGVTNVTIKIIAEKDHCELKLIQTGVSPDATEGNWRDMLKHLNVVVEGK